ncbi:MAG: SpoIIE family protein phosphatase [Gammaproteobacteria bacterium]|nr:SpoIIE family protein phosphatase [Gammaproteobacteria bacterium]
MSRISLRWKLLVLLLLIAVLPLAVTSIIDFRVLKRLGSELADQSGAALTEQARRSLERFADDYVRLMVSDKKTVELLLDQLVREAERALQQPPPADEQPFFAADFAAALPELELSLLPDKYVRINADGEAEPLPVSLIEPLIVTSPGVDATANLDAARQLASLRNLLIKLQRQRADLVFWEHITLESGIHLSYPGHGATPAGFEPRERVWYQWQQQTDRGGWSRPYTDANSRQTNLTLSAPLYDENGSFAGVAGIDVLITNVLSDVAFPEHLADDSEMVMVSLYANGSQGDLTPWVIARQGDQRAGSDWQEMYELEALMADNEVDQARLVSALQNAEGTLLRMPRAGQDAFWAVRPFGEGNSLLFIVPVATVLQPARNAAEYARSTTVRHMLGLAPVLVTVILFVILISFIASREVTVPIRNLSAAAGRIASGDFGAKVRVTTRDELQSLATAFNAMLPRLEEHTRMSETMAVAREVQKNLLPSHSPDLAGVDIAGFSAYCDQTGGDYYDYIDLNNVSPGLIGVTVGDVSGHGIPSALLMTTVRALLRSYTSNAASARDMLTHANRHLAADTQGGRFMTLFYLLINTGARTIEWASAGHDPAICYDPEHDRFEELAGDDIPLGVDGTWEFNPTRRADWNASHIIAIGTDGIWETRSVSGEMFGKDRFRDLLREHAADDSETMCRRVLDALCDFRGAAPQRDDITLVIVKSKPPAY